jgi:hypothetical protein
MAKYMIAHMETKKQNLLGESSRNKMFSMIAKREPHLSYGLGWKIKKIQ